MGDAVSRRTFVRGTATGVAGGIAIAGAAAIPAGAAPPAITHASWVNGNAFSPPETPGPGNFVAVDGVPSTDILGLHRGWGVTWRGRAGRTSWFHVPIPTPVIVNDVRLHLKRVFVLFEAGVSCDVTDVHIWDGNRRIQTFGPFARTGAHAGGLDQDNTFAVANNPAVIFGIGISVLIRFNTEANITFFSAGADFAT